MTWIKQSDWLTIRSGCGILIYSSGQGLINKLSGLVFVCLVICMIILHVACDFLLDNQDIPFQF